MPTDENANPDSVMDADTAADVLGVQREQVDAMIADGLLHPLEGHPEPVLDATEVHAVRNLGG